MVQFLGFIGVVTRCSGFRQSEHNGNYVGGACVTQRGRCFW